MLLSRYVSLFFTSTLFPLLLAAVTTGQLLLPRSNGAFEVGMGTAELIDESRLQPFAPTVQHPKFMVSLFYPVKSRKPTTPVKYMPPETAAYEDGSEQSLYGLASPNGTIEKLALQLAGNSSQTQATLTSRSSCSRLPKLQLACFTVSLRSQSQVRATLS